MSSAAVALRVCVLRWLCPGSWIVQRCTGNGCSLLQNKPWLVTCNKHACHRPHKSQQTTCQIVDCILAQGATFQPESNCSHSKHVLNSLCRRHSASLALSPLQCREPFASMCEDEVPFASCKAAIKSHQRVQTLTLN